MTTENLSLADLQKLLSNFKAADVKAMLKQIEAAKPTALSLTMDAIVTATLAGTVITANVHKTVCEKAAEHGMDSPQQSSTAALIRYAKAFDDAMVRAGFGWSKKAAEPTEPDATAEPVSETPTNTEEPPVVSLEAPRGRKAA